MQSKGHAAHHTTRCDTHHTHTQSQNLFTLCTADTQAEFSVWSGTCLHHSSHFSHLTHGQLTHPEPHHVTKHWLKIEVTGQHWWPCIPPSRGPGMVVPSYVVKPGGETGHQPCTAASQQHRRTRPCHTLSLLLTGAAVKTHVGEQHRGVRARDHPCAKPCRGNKKIWFQGLCCSSQAMAGSRLQTCQTCMLSRQGARKSDRQQLHWQPVYESVLTDSVTTRVAAASCL